MAESLLTASRAEDSVPDGLFAYAKSYIVVLVMFLFVQGNGLFSTSAGAAGTTDTAQNSTLALLNAFLCLLTGCLLFPASKRLVHDLLQQPLIAAFFVLAPLSSLWSSISIITFRHALFLDVSILFSLWFLNTYAIHEQEDLILRTGVVVGVASLVLAVTLPQYGRMSTGEWKGVFWHKNELAQAMELLFSPLLFRSTRLRLSSASMVLMAFLGLLLLAMSQARTGMLLTGIMVALAGFARIVRSAPRFRVFVYYLAAIALLMGVSAAIVGQRTILELLGKSPNFTGRFDTWPILIPFIFKHSALGYGYSGFWTGYSGDSGTALSGMSGAMNTADNGYIDIALQFGFLGLALLVLTLLKALYEFGQISKRADIPLSAFWYLALVLDAILGNLSGTFFFNPYGISTLTLVLGCVGLSQLRRASNDQM